MKRIISLVIFILIIVTSANSQSKKVKQNVSAESKDWFQLAWDAKAGGYLEDACFYFQKYIEAGNTITNEAIAYANWGNTLVDMNRRDNDESLLVEAIEKHKKSVELRPEGVNSYNSLATVYILLADARNDVSLYQEAVENFKKSHELNPPAAYSCSSMGYAMLKVAKLNNTLVADKEQIVEIFTKAIELGNQNSSYNLACVYALTGDTEKAFYWLNFNLSKSTSTTKEFINSDKDFDSIRSDDRFQKILDSLDN